MSLSKFGNNVQYIVAGDYNLPKTVITSDNTGLITNSILTPQAYEIFDIYAYNNFFQVNTHSNFKGSMLDLVFTSSNLTTSNICDELLVPLDKYYTALSIHSNYDVTRDFNHIVDSNWYYDFKIADYTSICWSLGLTNWHNLFGNKNINEILI